MGRFYHLISTSLFAFHMLAFVVSISRFIHACNTNVNISIRTHFVFGSIDSAYLYRRRCINI